MRVIGRLVRTVVVTVAAGTALVAALGLAYASLTPVSTLMLGRRLAGDDVNRTYVPLAAMAPDLPAAVIRSEDARFCLHHGVDWDALRAVIASSDEDGPDRGASTLTMQVAKNLFLWPSRSYVRKALEIPLALYLDLVLGKRRVAEIYLNIAEWGDGVFGAEAAAQRHFGRSARTLTGPQAALLAVTLPGPTRRDPARPTRTLRTLAARVLADLPNTNLSCLGRLATVD